jgi:hypothetical protein
VAVREKVGLDESEWRDDPAALADWAAWLDTAEPVEFATPGPFEEEFPRFNVEAVAFALGDCVVVTGDTDLSDVPGLDVEDWSVPKASV